MKKYDLQDMRMVLHVANSFLHKPYIFGGKGSRGIDCSGLVVECLMSIGAMGLHQDLTAHNIWTKFSEYRDDEPSAGAFACWWDGRGKKGKISHIAICIDKRFCITADGGGKTTKTLVDAMTKQARVKIRRIDHRMKLPKGYINLFQ